MNRNNWKKYSFSLDFFFSVHAHLNICEKSSHLTVPVNTECICNFKISVSLHILVCNKSGCTLSSKYINNHCNILYYCDIRYDNSLAACLCYTLRPFTKLFDAVCQKKQRLVTLPNSELTLLQGDIRVLKSEC